MYTVARYKVVEGRFFLLTHMDDGRGYKCAFCQTTFKVKRSAEGKHYVFSDDPYDIQTLIEVLGLDGPHATEWSMEDDQPTAYPLGTLQEQVSPDTDVTTSEK